MRYVGNWFEDNPVKSIIGHTLLVAGVTAGAFIFVFDSNKVTATKAEADQYKAKTETLEAQIASLKEENERYLGWLTSTQNSFPALEIKIKSLTEANKSLQGALDARNIKPTVSGTEERAATISVGDTFVDDQTGVSFGLGGVTHDFKATGLLMLPSGKAEEITEVRPGQAWNFEFKNEPYQIQLRNVDWYSNKVTIAIKQIPK
jgi:hypothetical protein